MAEGTNVGAIYYEVEADTSKLVNSVAPVDKSLDGLNKTFSKTDKAANQANFRMTKTAAAVKSLGQQSSKTTTIMRSLTTVLSAAVLVKLGRDIVAASDAWTDLQNRLRLVTGTQKELAQATDDVFRIAQSTSQEIDSIAQVYQRFAQNADTLGLSLDDVAEVTDIVAKAVAVSGASAQAAEAALTQFGQALASGVLRGEELNSVMEQTPALAKAIADGMGITIGQLRAVAAEGKITATELIAALKASSGSVDEQFNTRIKTTAQSWTELRNSIARFLGEASNASALTASLSDGLDRISKAIDNIDIDSLALEIEGIKSIISLVMDGVDELMRGAAEGADESAQGMTLSFVEMALEVSRLVDGIATTFQGTAGAVGAVWQALANNIPAYFSNAWSEIKSGAVGFVNDLADLINKPIQALGGAGIGRVEADIAPIRAVISLTEAAADGWNEAAKGVGAYERTLRRVTDSAINSSIAEWQAEYTEETKKATTATNNLAAASGKLTPAQRKEAQAREANKKAIDGLAQALMQAGLEGEELAVAKARAQLNVFATPEEIAQVEALARAIHQVMQAEADRALVSAVDPVAAEVERYDAQVKAFEDMLERKRISQEEFDVYMQELKLKHDETMAALTEENWQLAQDLETARYKTELDQLAAQFMANEIAYADYYARLNALQSQHAATSQKIEEARGRAILASVSQSFDAATAAIGNSFGKQNALYKAMFAASKAFAIAEAAILIQQGIAGAWALPFPANLPAVAQVMAGTASILSNINSIAFGGGKQYGGPVNAEKMYRINETGRPEILNLANGQQFLLPNQRGEVVSNRDATRGAAGGTTIHHHYHNTIAPVIHATWPLPDKEVRRLVKQLNDAVEDGMIIT